MSVNIIYGTYVPQKPSIDVIPNIILKCNNIKKLYINQAVLLEFKVEGINEKDIGGTYNVKLISSDINIKLFNSKKEYKNEFEIEKGWIFSVYIVGLKLINNAKIDIYINNIKKDSFTVSVYQDKDVFIKEDIKRLKVNVGVLGLSSTACINVADARISELLQDKDNFMNKDRQKMSHGEYINRLKYLSNKGFVLGDIKDFRYYLNNEEKYRPKKLKESIKLYIESQINLRIGYHVYYISLLNDVHVLTLIINNINPCGIKYEVLDQGTKWKTEGEQNFNTIDDYFNESTISLYDWYLKAHKIQGIDNTRIAKIKRL